MGLALVDLDGTLIRGSSEGVLFLHLLRTRALGPHQVRAGLGFLLREAPRYGVDVIRKNKSYLSELPVSLVQAAARRVVEEVLLGRVRPCMRARLAEHARDRHVVVLLTGAPEFIAAPMAQALGIPHWVATECAQRDGHFVAGPPLRHPHGPEKARIAGALAARFGVSLEQCVAYADSGSDAALLERVGRPVPVYPDFRLARIARRRGWRVLGPAD